jgi:hypothetical protein
VLRRHIVITGQTDDMCRCKYKALVKFETGGKQRDSALTEFFVRSHEYYQTDIDYLYIYGISD